MILKKCDKIIAIGYLVGMW